jgi:ribose-phosphate pyrophosphokinase
MKYLNLDKQFEPFGSSIQYESHVFNGGEPHIKIDPKIELQEDYCITIRIKSFNDIGLLMVAVDALRRLGVLNLSLFLPYFPGARQDRLMIPGEPLTVKLYADLINTLDFQHVIIFDPHSAVTPALINNVQVIDNSDFVKNAIQKTEINDYLLIAPDGGSLKKIYKTSAFLGGIEVVECSKLRDVKTGKLSNFKVGKENLNNQTCVIVDDICDGGGTFIGLAEQLKKHNAGRLVLIVSHGIFSKGIVNLREHFNHIITTDSFRDHLMDGLIQLKLGKEIKIEQ